MSALSKLPAKRITTVVTGRARKVVGAVNTTSGAPHDQHARDDAGLQVVKVDDSVVSVPAVASEADTLSDLSPVAGH